MRRLVLAAVISTTFASQACSSPAAPANTRKLELSADANALTLHNPRPAPVYFFVVGRTTAALVDWIPCTDPERCRNVQPSQTLRVNIAEIPGGTEPELIVYWWHLVAAPAGGIQIDSMRSEIVSRQH